MTTYKIIRFFQREDIPNEVIETGLTLEQAQEHCEDPNTSSRTAMAKWAKAITKNCGAWFDGYREEEE